MWSPPWLRRDGVDRKKSTIFKTKSEVSRKRNLALLTIPLLMLNNIWFAPDII